jgi:hypothetical protein
MAVKILPELRGPVQFPDLSAFAGSGVYFLYREGVIVYVGQAVDMRRRLGQHLGDILKRFDSVACVRCPIDQLDRLERHYIEELVPEYNQCSLASFLRRANNGSFKQPPLAKVLKPKPSRRRRAFRRAA